MNWTSRTEQGYYEACTGVIRKKLYKLFFFADVRCQQSGITINLKYGWIINQSIDSGEIHWFINLSWYHVRLLKKFQSFILIRQPPFSNPGLFALFYKFLFLCRQFSSILFGMKGRESDFPTYSLHFYITKERTSVVTVFLCTNT